MTEEQLKKLAGIIAALQDIQDSVKAGKRLREYAESDLLEEIDALSDFVNSL